jgi:hypothetical protein
METEYTLTHNDALTHVSSQSCFVDFFFKIVRDTKEETVFQLLKKCWDINPLWTLKLVFHLRDTRGGKGEKKQFYTCLIWIESFHPYVIYKNFDNIAKYGYYKDFYCLLNSPSDVYVINYLSDVIRDDLTKEPCYRSLCSKWLPNEGSSLDVKYKVVNRLCKSLGMTKKEYRKTLVKLRSSLNIVEIPMCKNDWNSIDFSKVTSVAFKRYKKAFQKHSPELFEEFLSRVKKGESKINTSRLFPHEIINDCNKNDYDEAIELQWTEYLRGLNVNNLKNTLAVVDVSGSMNSIVGSSSALMIAVSLGMVCSHFAQGCFKDTWITFSNTPTLEKIHGETLKDKINNMITTHWEMSTNLCAVFRLLLGFATLYNTPIENFPKTIFIFSDMQFDSACPFRTNFEVIDDMFKDAGFRRPKIVFWKIDSKNTDVPVRFDENGVVLLSGYSPELMKLVLEDDDITPLRIVENIINSERYNSITL